MHLIKSKQSKQQKSESLLFEYNQPFILESGEVLPQMEIAYTTHGKRNSANDNVVWVFHGLTANANPLDWWSELIGPGKSIDTNKYFVICANSIGSCYGSTGPGSINPLTGKIYGLDFPKFTIRDMVKFNQLLQQYLEIGQVFLGIGGSMGGQQLLEWSITDPHRFQHICLVATNARHSAWGIAFNETQRMALEANGFTPKGLAIARAIALLSYRHQNTYRKTQTDFDGKTDDFKASSYQRYQGLKLSKRFNAFSYYYLTKAMDSHNIGRGRKSARHSLRLIEAKTLCVGLKTDILFPFAEQKFLSKNITQGQFALIDSVYGHDGFLIEAPTIGKHITKFLNY